MVAPGDILLGKYRVERMIGKGGMATVVAATHLELGELVAIKVLLTAMLANPVIVQRFLLEARAAVRLKGEHSVRVLDVGAIPGGPPFMVMELLVGVDLGVDATQRGRLPSTEAVDYILQACEALAEAHAAGIVHRDIKPSNLFITRRPDGSPLLKVLDFGISKVASDDLVSDLTRDSVVGTPAYMSPEQLRSSAEIDGRADIWSLGVVLYRLLAGVRPFKADSLSALAIQAATERAPPLPPPFPPGIDLIIDRCLQKEPGHRYPSVAELARALAPYAGDPRAAAIVVERSRGILSAAPPAFRPTPVSIEAPEPTTLGSSVAAMLAPPDQRRSFAWILGGSAVIGVVAAIALSWTGSESRLDLVPGASPPAAASAPSGHEPAITAPPHADGTAAPLEGSASAPGGDPAAPPALPPAVPAPTGVTAAPAPPSALAVPAAAATGSASAEGQRPGTREVAPVTPRPRRTRPPRGTPPERPSPELETTSPAGADRPTHPANPLDTRM